MENFFTTSLTKDPAMPSPACWKTTAGQGEKRETPLALGRSLARYGCLGIIYWTSCNPSPKDPTLRCGLRLVRRNLTIKVSCRQKRLAGRAFFRCCSSNGCRPRFNHNHLGIIHKFCTADILCTSLYYDHAASHCTAVYPATIASKPLRTRADMWPSRTTRTEKGKQMSKPCTMQTPKNNYSKTPRPPVEPTAL
jgi:hypothetical protein